MQKIDRVFVANLGMILWGYSMGDKLIREKRKEITKEIWKDGDSRRSF